MHREEMRQKVLGKLEVGETYANKFKIVEILSDNAKPIIFERDGNKSQMTELDFIRLCINEIGKMR